LRLSPEVFNQLRVLQKKAREIRQDVRTLRKASQSNALQISDIVSEAAAKITAAIEKNSPSIRHGPIEAERLRLHRDEDTYRSDMARLDKDLTKTVADLKIKLPLLQEGLGNIISAEMEQAMKEKK
ncbi:Coiled-coil domain-containing protein, partial [Armadillidium nasatum]